MKKQTPLVSIIITTKNEADVIVRLLESIKKQTYSSLETIVVDNNSQDETVKLSSKFPVRIYNYGPERSAQRNYGFAQAKGDYVMFLDADMQLEKNVVKECLDILRLSDSFGAVIIPEVSVAQKYWEKVKAFERSFYNQEGDNLTDAARFYSREVLEKIGGYDESLTGPEDWELSERVLKFGYKLGRIKSVIYHYERINSLYSLAKKKFYYGKKASRYFQKQKMSAFSAKTVYFLRPVFYRQWRRILRHPFLSISMFIMFICEMFAGGLGYLLGKKIYAKA